MMHTDEIICGYIPNKYLSIRKQVKSTADNATVADKSDNNRLFYGFNL